MRQEILDILENLEDYRKKIVSGELVATAEHAIRICQAHVADFGPWESRSDWVKALEEDSVIEIPAGDLAEVQTRNRRLDELAPLCNWAEAEHGCTVKDMAARAEYREIMKTQSAWEVERGL